MATIKLFTTVKIDRVYELDVPDSELLAVLTEAINSEESAKEILNGAEIREGWVDDELLYYLSENKNTKIDEDTEYPEVDVYNISISLENDNLSLANVINLFGGKQ